MQYDGLPMDGLPIEDVSWPDPTHLQRSTRYPNEEDITPDHATEAALDTHRLIGPDRTSRTGESIRIIGYSPTAGRVLVVALLPTEHPPAGQWVGVTARPANRAERLAYLAAQEER